MHISIFNKIRFRQIFVIQSQCVYPFHFASSLVTSTRLTKTINQNAIFDGYTVHRAQRHTMTMRVYIQSSSTLMLLRIKSFNATILILQSRAERAHTHSIVVHVQFEDEEKMKLEEGETGWFELSIFGIAIFGPWTLNHSIHTRRNAWS